MQHLIRPRPPLGAAGLLNLVAVAALGLLIAAQAIGSSVLLIVAVVLLVLAGMALLGLLGWWRRSRLVVSTDAEGITAVSAGSSARAAWSEVEAVTVAGNELRLRRAGGLAVVLRLPARVEAGRVEALVADVTARLDARATATTLGGGAAVDPTATDESPTEELR